MFTYTPNSTITIKDGVYTILSGKTGNHKTFKVATHVSSNPEKPSYWNNKQIVSIRIAKEDNNVDNTDCWFAFGHVTKTEICVWRKRTNENRFGIEFFERLAVVAAKLMNAISASNSQEITINGNTILFAVDCMACGETLYNPESIRKGIGPVCEKKARAGKGITTSSATSTIAQPDQYVSAKLNRSVKLDGISI